MRDVPKNLVNLRRLGLVVAPEMLPGIDGENICGPSLIEAPEWLGNRLGRYYLYFAHHNGDYIRLAYADHLSGPWRIHAPGTLALSQCPECRGHIASPDVHVDHEARSIRMYFHGPSARTEGQKSFVALSVDGISFTPSSEILGMFYFRLFRWRGMWYALGKSQLYRSRDGLTQFEEGSDIDPLGFDKGINHAAIGSIRHTAVEVRGSEAYVYFTRLGDAPERIMRGVIDLTEDWRHWRLKATTEVLRPELPWEGADLPNTPSKPGPATTPRNEVRDPCVYLDSSGKRYLLYCVQGERGIAVAELPVIEGS